MHMSVYVTKKSYSQENSNINTKCDTPEQADKSDHGDEKLPEEQQHPHVDADGNAKNEVTSESEWHEAAKDMITRHVYVWDTNNDRYGKENLDSHLAERMNNDCAFPISDTETNQSSSRSYTSSNTSSSGSEDDTDDDDDDSKSGECSLNKALPVDESPLFQPKRNVKEVNNGNSAVLIQSQVKLRDMDTHGCSQTESGCYSLVKDLSQKDPSKPHKASPPLIDIADDDDDYSYKESSMEEPSGSQMSGQNGRSKLLSLTIKFEK